LDVEEEEEEDGVWLLWWWGWLFDSMALTGNERGFTSLL
jgi:hypothetical protein